MSCEVSGSYACAHVCVCSEHADLVQGVVNWLRLTFSRGIGKGTVVPLFLESHLQNMAIRSLSIVNIILTE